MIVPGFLDAKSRRDLIELTRDALAANRLARRANALLLLDEGLSCVEVAKVLARDDDTIRTWYKLYRVDGIAGLARSNYKGSDGLLTAGQQDKLKAWIAETLPRTTHQAGAWIAAEFGIEYQSRGGLIALLHRLGMEYRKPLAAYEVAALADATHQAGPDGYWAPKAACQDTNLPPVTR